MLLGDIPSSHRRASQHRAARLGLTAILVANLASCSAAPATVAPPSPSSSAVATASAAIQIPAAKLGLLIDRETPAAARPAPIPAESLPVFDGHFEPVKLPRKVGPLLAVTGTGDRDVWLLAAGGPVLRWDGTRVADRGTPRCFTDLCCGTLIDCARQPNRCREKSDCSFQSQDCANLVAWSFLDSTPSGVLAGASLYTGGMRSSIVWARPGAAGWSCEQGKDDVAYAGSRGRGDGEHALEMTLDGVAIRFEEPVFLANRVGGYHLTIAGRAVALPEGLGERAGFTARSPADLWLWNIDAGRVWHGNGLTWSSVEARLQPITRVWTTGPALVWALGEGAGCKESEVLVQWDVERGTEQRFCVPGAKRVITSPQDFWLLGEDVRLGEDGPALDMGDKSFYFWDGSSLRRAGAPLAFGGAWRSPSGALWVAGADRAAKKPTGAVFRLAAMVGE